MFVVGAPGVVLGFKFSQELGEGLAMGLALASFLIFLFGMGSFFLSFAHMPWRHGRILPALVESRAGPPEQSDNAGCAMVLLPPGLGLLAEVLTFTNRERNPNAMLLSWLDGGRLRHANVLAGAHWGKWEAGDIVWICSLPVFKTSVVETVCPRSFIVPPVPPDVATRFKSDLAHYHSLGDEGRLALRQRFREETARARREDREFRKAARASTQRYQQASRYEKRPD
ncbi:MAG: hypothetical protein R3E76_16895 [Planctomycetota bacterium]